MKCPACGREMFCWGSQLECTNVLCDYMEELETKGASIGCRVAVPRIVVLWTTTSLN